jgi:hypothetical protein
MATYKVTAQVDYIVQANNLTEAIDMVQENTEHPLIGGNEIGYCDNVQVIAGTLQEKAEA